MHERAKNGGVCAVNVGSARMLNVGVLVKKLLQNLRKSGLTLKFLVVDGAGIEMATYICKRHAGGRVKIDQKN